MFSQCILPKKRKLALLLSAFHRTDTKAEGVKPKIVEFYNQTKAVMLLTKRSEKQSFGIVCKSYV